MTSQPWNEEMSHLLFKIERETESSICKLKKSLKRCGLNFDGKFRKYFLKATDNRLSETFDRFEIDNLEETQHRPGHDSVDIRQNFRDRNQRGVSLSHRHIRSRSQRHRRTRSRSRSHDRAQRSRSQHHTNYSSKKATSVKERLGSQMKKQPPPIKERVKAKSTKSKPHNQPKVETMEAKPMGSKTESKSGKKLPLIAEEPVNFERLEVILNKSMAIPPKPTSFTDLIFSCIYCQNTSDHSNSASQNIEDVYAHWLSGHTDMSNVQPFAFAISEPNSACFYCDKVGTLHQLVAHQKEHHRNRSIAIVTPSNRKECMLCGYSGTNWSDHFETTHKMFLKMDDFNPISLSNETLQEILSIDIHKKRQCGRCEEIFETEHQVECHSLNEHPNEEIVSKVVDDTQKMHFICDVCHEQVSPDDYINHLEEHPYNFQCSKCEFNSGDLVEVAFHEHDVHHTNALSFHYLQFTERLKSHFFCTKAVFGNGLILTKHNLLGTNHDDYSQFRYMVETMVDIKVKKFGWLMQKQHCDEKSEHLSDNDTSSVSTDEFMLATLASSPAFNHTSIPIRKQPPSVRNSVYFRELNQQHRIVKNVCIHGVPRRENENLREIVERVCEMLEANISASEIAVVHRISKSDPLIIVKFTNNAAKQRVMISRRGKDILTSDIIDILPGVMPSKIHIFSHLTDFFEELRKCAKQAVQEQRLYAYCLTKHGFLVRRTKHSADKYIFSRNELRAYIGRGLRNGSVSRSSDDI